MTCEQLIADLNNKIQGLSTKELNKQIRSINNSQLLQLANSIKNVEDRNNLHSLHSVLDQQTTCKHEIDLNEYHYLITSYRQRLKIGVCDAEIDQHREELKYLATLKETEAEKRYYSIFARVQNMEEYRIKIKARYERNILNVEEEGRKVKPSKLTFQLSHKLQMENDYNDFSYSYIVFVKLTLAKQHQRLAFLMKNLRRSVEEIQEILTLITRIKYLEREHGKLLLEIHQLSSVNFSLLKTLITIDCFNASFLKIIFNVLKMSINLQKQETVEKTECQPAYVSQSNNYISLHSYLIDIFLNKFFKHIELGEDQHVLEEKYDVQGINLNVSKVDCRSNCQEFHEHCTSIISQFPENIRYQIAHELQIQSYDIDFSQSIPEEGLHLLKKQCQSRQSTTFSLTQHQKQTFISQTLKSVEPFYIMGILQNSTLILVKFGSKTKHLQPVCSTALLSAKGFFTTLKYPYRNENVPYSDIKIVTLNVVEYKLKKSAQSISNKKSTAQKMQSYSHIFERIVKNVQQKKRQFNFRTGLWNLYNEKSAEYQLMQKINSSHEITTSFDQYDFELNISLYFMNYYIRKISNIEEHQQVHPIQVLISSYVVSIFYLSFKNYILSGNESEELTVEDISFMRKYLIKAQKFINYFRGCGISRKVCNNTLPNVMNYHTLSHMNPKIAYHSIMNSLLEEEALLESEGFLTFRLENYWLTSMRETKRAIHQLVKSPDFRMKDTMMLIKIQLIFCKVCEQNVGMLRIKNKIDFLFRQHLFILSSIIILTELISSIFTRETSMLNRKLMEVYSLLFVFFKKIQLSESAVKEKGFQQQILQEMGKFYQQERYFERMLWFSLEQLINMLKEECSSLAEVRIQKIKPCSRSCRTCRKYELKNGCFSALETLCVDLFNHRLKPLNLEVSQSNDAWMKQILQYYSNFMRQLYPNR